MRLEQCGKWQSRTTNVFLLRRQGNKVRSEGSEGCRGQGIRGLRTRWKVARGHQADPRKPIPVNLLKFHEISNLPALFYFTSDRKVPTVDSPCQVPNRMIFSRLQTFDFNTTNTCLCLFVFVVWKCLFTELQAKAPSPTYGSLDGSSVSFPAGLNSPYHLDSLLGSFPSLQVLPDCETMGQEKIEVRAWFLSPKNVPSAHLLLAGKADHQHTGRSHGTCRRCEHPTNMVL